MTHRGPFQPLPFCDSVILWYSGSAGPGPASCRSPLFFQKKICWGTQWITSCSQR